MGRILAPRRRCVPSGLPSGARATTKTLSSPGVGTLSQRSPMAALPAWTRSRIKSNSNSRPGVKAQAIDKDGQPSACCRRPTQEPAGEPDSRWRHLCRRLHRLWQAWFSSCLRHQVPGPRNHRRPDRGQNPTPKSSSTTFSRSRLSMKPGPTSPLSNGTCVSPSPLVMLGPALEAHRQRGPKPLIERVFAIANRAGIHPSAPA